MFGKFAPVSMLTLATIFAAAPFAIAEEKPPVASQASEQVPDSSVRGETYNGGPNKMELPFVGKKKEHVEVRETYTTTTSSTKGPRQIILDGKLVTVDENMKVIETHGEPSTPPPSSTPSTPPAPSSPSAPSTPAPEGKSGKSETPKELTPAERAELDSKMRSAIRRLGTSGWREAQIQIRESGRNAIPYLIDAMGTPETEKVDAAYHLGGHTKADAGRGPRQRPISEVCAELLTEIVSTRSNYRGELPALDQKAWQQWWAANGEVVSFGK